MLTKYAEECKNTITRDKGIGRYFLSKNLFFERMEKHGLWSIGSGAHKVMFSLLGQQNTPIRRKKWLFPSVFLVHVDGFYSVQGVSRIRVDSTSSSMGREGSLERNDGYQVAYPFCTGLFGVRTGFCCTEVSGRGR